MATSVVQHLGVSAPISEALPTESEKEKSNALIEELRRQNNYESATETNKRSVVLQSLQKVTEEFVKLVYRKKGYSESVVNGAGGKVLTYGSFRLGVIGPGSDIDTLVVAPKHVSREEYFEFFPDLLTKMAPDGAITDLTLVPDSYVPIITFEYSDISIDLIFCSLDIPQIPQSLQHLRDNSLLKGLNAVDLRCVNGTRVTDEILELVPQKGVFRTALRGIKLWAQRRAIYANIMGFPGGVAWAMLVARVCQLYPMAVASTIMLKFFLIIGNWRWPQPVLLKTIEDIRLPDTKVWNPQIYKTDSFHLMPIITPAYPSMCATHNITASTQEVIQRELKRGGNITSQVFAGKAQWKDLFAKHTFFTQNYKYYLHVVSASTTKEAQLIWSGWIESKVRLFVQKLEMVGDIALAHPFNKGFERVHKCKTDEEVEKVQGGSLIYQVKEVPTATTDTSLDTNLGAIVKSDVTDTHEELKDSEHDIMVYTTTFYIGLELTPGSKSLDLAWAVEDYKRLCKGWEKYDAELNALNVIHTKNYQLPDDVFSEGEVKPTRVEKKKASNGVAKKRTATDDTTLAPAKRHQT